MIGFFFKAFPNASHGVPRRLTDVSDVKRDRDRESGSEKRGRGVYSERKREKKEESEWCGLLMIRQWDDGTMNGIQRDRVRERERGVESD